MLIRATSCLFTYTPHSHSIRVAGFYPLILPPNPACSCPSLSLAPAILGEGAASFRQGWCYGFHIPPKGDAPQMSKVLSQQFPII